MRALAVSGPTAEDGIKSLKEQGIDVVLGNWRGIFGAPGITPAQRDQLVKLVQAATETPAWKETLSRMGWTSVVPRRRPVQGLPRGRHAPGLGDHGVARAEEVA